MSEFETFEAGTPVRIALAAFGVLTFLGAAPCLYYFWSNFVVGADDRLGILGFIGLVLFVFFVGFMALWKAWIWNRNT